MKNRNLTEGSILKNLMLFSLPMMAGNFLQQIYNIADMIIVGRFIGSDALAAVKIDTLAYMPAQEFGNAYSLFISQNYGAQKRERIKKGTKLATCVSVVFCVVVSVFIFLTAKGLMKLFVDSTETSIIEAGVKYLRIEGSFYFGIGILFLLYGYFRGIQRAEVSLVLTIISLGTRVVLSYLLAPNTALGVQAIWWSIPIGWILADIVGMILQKEEIKNGKKSYNR